MEIRILYFEGCPHAELARERVLEAVANRPDTTVAMHRVASQAEGDRLGFSGSPTILVDGADPFTAPQGPSWSCRLYPTGQGSEGAPTVDQLLAVLTH